MKTSIFFVAFSIFALSIFLIWSHFDMNDHDTTINVSEDDNTYTFNASYNRANTGMVEHYINQSISPDRLGNSENDHIDAYTSLPDNSRFYVYENAGKLIIKLDKRKNTTASYYRIKKMCDGIKSLLTGK